MADQQTTAWRPISEAPRQDDVLVCRVGMLGWWAVAWCCALGEWHKSSGLDRLPHDPTHWMPLPDVPRMRPDAH